MHVKKLSREAALASRIRALVLGIYREVGTVTDGALYFGTVEREIQDLTKEILMPGQDDRTSATTPPAIAPMIGPEAIEIADKTDSVEISVNAKGDISYKVKAYAETAQEALLRAESTLVEARNFVERMKKGDTGA